MSGSTSDIAATLVIDRSQVGDLVEVLRRRGYCVIGPTRRGGAIVYDEMTSAADLPAGWTDEQEPGSYRLRRRPDAALFGYAVGPHSWKRYLHPPVLRLFEVRLDGDASSIVEASEAPPAHAFLGVRACELAAIARQDQVFLEGPYVDATYQARRTGAFLVAVNCTAPAGTCFCASMDTGPAVRGGFDLALTELAGDGRHVFVVAVGSARGRDVIDEVGPREASAREIADAAALVASAREHMGRTLDTAGLAGALLRQPESPRWEQVASRCLACGNCTMSCPTCFCATVTDTASLAGDRAARWRAWDTCFSVDFSYMNGGCVRLSVRSRYRQWLTHKLATWHDQFGVSGCVGCGRCITWCPAGIDLTVEARAIRDADAGPAGSPPPEPIDDVSRAPAG
jgi:sulfhydrogenase subunit beta (sulfur reductase)